MTTPAPNEKSSLGWLTLACALVGLIGGAITLKKELIALDKEVFGLKAALLGHAKEQVILQKEKLMLQAAERNTSNEKQPVATQAAKLPAVSAPIPVAITPAVPKQQPVEAADTWTQMALRKEIDRQPAASANPKSTVVATAPQQQPSSLDSTQQKSRETQRAMSREAQLPATRPELVSPAAPAVREILIAAAEIRRIRETTVRGNATFDARLRVEDARIQMERAAYIASSKPYMMKLVTASPELRAALAEGDRLHHYQAEYKRLLDQ